LCFAPFTALRPQLSMDAAEFHAKVYDACRLIPHGKVTSYGHIAKLIGMPRHSRHVGQALKFLGDDNVSWQRVIGASGTISSRGPGTDGAQRQAQALRAEGVDVQLSRGGQYTISLAEYGWFPEHIELDEE